MALVTVTNTLLSSLGAPRVNVPVGFALCVDAFGPGGTGGEYEILGDTSYVRTDDTGTYTLSVQPNAEVTPAGTFYIVSEPNGVTHKIIVPAGGPYWLKDVLADDPTPPVGGGVLYLRVDGDQALSPEQQAFGKANLGVTGGGGGTGTVDSVNGQLPDGTGNVTLTAANVGADAAGAAATAQTNAEAYTDAHITALGLGSAATHAATDFDAAGAASAAQANAEAYADGKLAKASNLSDVVDAATARTNLGLGTSATHASTDFDSAGSASAAQAAAQTYADRYSGSAAGTASRPLAATDAAVTNARTPTAHASTHAAAGSDPITITEAQVIGLTTDLAGKVPATRTLAGLDLSADRTAAAIKGALGITEADVSGLVADLAAKIALSIVTTKGDLIVGTGSGTVARQAVGSNGQVLTADSTQAGGMKWASGGGGWLYTDPAVGQYVRTPFAVNGSGNRAFSSFPTGSSLPRIFIPIRGSYTIGSVVMKIGTAGGAGSTVTINVRNDDGSGRPSGSVLVAATCATSATGVIETSCTATVVTSPGVWVEFSGWTDSATQVQTVTCASIPSANLNTNSGWLFGGLGGGNPGENQNSSLWDYFPDIALKRTA